MFCKKETKQILKNEHIKSYDKIANKIKRITKIL